MGNTYVELNFRLTTYKNENETEQEISFEGHGGWQRMMFHKQPPGENQVRLLAELSRILNELARGNE